MGCAASKPEPAQQQSQDDQQDEEGDYNPLTEDEVNARIVCSPKAELFKLGKSGITLRYAYLSQRGYYPEDLYKANQDAFKVVPRFGGNDDHIFFGVFDGHGVDGDSCSYFVRDNIEGELKRQLKNYPDDFEKAYKEAFIGVNLRMHEQVSTRKHAGWSGSAPGSVPLPLPGASGAPNWTVRPPRRRCIFLSALLRALLGGAALLFLSALSRARSPAARLPMLTSAIWTPSPDPRLLCFL